MSTKVTTTAQTLSLAMLHHQAGQLEQAEANYRQVLSEDENNFAANHMLGVVRYQLGDLAQAQQLLMRAVELNASIPEVHYNLGNVYAAQDRPTEALACYNQALVINKDFAAARQQLAKLAVKVEQLEHHAPVFEVQPTKLTPTEQSLSLAMQHHQAGQLEQAESIYQQVLSGDSNNFAANHMLGVVRYQLGDLAQAQQFLLRAVELNAAIPEVHYNLGNIYAAQGRPTEAIACYNQALVFNKDYAAARQQLAKLGKSNDIAVKTDLPECHEPVVEEQPTIPMSKEQSLNLAMQYHQAGQLEQAEAIYRQVLSEDANDFAANHMLGVVRYQLGDLAQAEQFLQRTVELNASVAEVHYNLGNVFAAQGRMTEARTCYTQALVVNKDFGAARQRMILQDKANDQSILKTSDSIKVRDVAATKITKAGAEPINKKVMEALRYQDLGNISMASKLFREVLAKSPEDWMALYSLGRILFNEGKPQGALKILEKLVVVNKQYASGFFLMTQTLMSLGRFDEALTANDKGLSLDLNDVNGLNQRANLMSMRNRTNDAIICCERALAINPKDEHVLFNLASLLVTCNRYKEVGIWLKRLISVNPEFPLARSSYIYNKLFQADWEGINEEIALLEENIRLGKISGEPIHFMAIFDSARDQFLCAKYYADSSRPICIRPFWNGERYRHEKIRIGYMSADFREHPVGHLMAGVIERHDKSRFEIIGLSLGIDDKSSLRSRFMASFDKFVDASLMDSDALSKLIRTLEVDIVVDLSGFTRGARIGLFANRVAPIQVNFLGFPGTMGADYMDYIIADKNVITEADQIYYAEKVAYLPDTYLPTNSDLKVGMRLPTRAEAGLPDSGFVFCSFNNIYKINSSMFDTWMTILAAVEGSVLWLSKPNEDALDNLRKEAARHGIDPQRLVFAGRVPNVEDHLARYSLVDLFLDTSPYNAHTTASDALFTGLPVITYSGNSFASRVAGSLLKAIGLSELVTESLEQYSKLALLLAHNPAHLAIIKSKLRTNKSTFPLFDANRYCRNLEAVFTTMWERQQAGKAPACFAVEAS